MCYNINREKKNSENNMNNYTVTNRWKSTQNFLEFNLIKVFFATMIVYPFVFAANSRFVSNFGAGLSIIGSIAIFMAAYSFVFFLFNKIDYALVDRNGARTNYVDRLMSFVRTGSFLFVLFALYRILLTGYLKVDVDTILPELYLLGTLPRVSFNYDHNTAVIANVGIAFPVVVGVIYSGLAIMRRFTR